MGSLTGSSESGSRRFFGGVSGYGRQGVSDIRILGRLAPSGVLVRDIPDRNNPAAGGVAGWRLSGDPERNTYLLALLGCCLRWIIRETCLEGEEHNFASVSINGHAQH